MFRKLFAATTAISLIACTAIAAPAPAPAPSPTAGEAAFRELYKELVETNTTLSAGDCTLAASQLAARSEERRVGKECRRLCRSRWSPYH
jgi:hypothetical protein